MKELIELFAEKVGRYPRGNVQDELRSWAANEITTLRQQLANSETRVTDAIRCLETVSGKAELGASVVRAERTEVMDHVAEGFDVIKKYAKSEAARLRQQADEAEKAGVS